MSVGTSVGGRRIWTGGQDAEIVPYGDFVLSPAAAVFHYGAEIFEGLKAYRTAEGKVQLFRPIENVRRMNNSAERLCMPQMPEEEMLAQDSLYTTEISQLSMNFRTFD